MDQLFLDKFLEEHNESNHESNSNEELVPSITVNNFRKAYGQLQNLHSFIIQSADFIQSHSKNYWNSSRWISASKQQSS